MLPEDEAWRVRWRKDGGPIMRLPVVMPLFKHLPQRLWVLAFLRTYAKKGELSLLNELYDYLPDDVAAELRAPKPVGVVVLGDASVGKTSLIKALLGGARDEVGLLISLLKSHSPVLLVSITTWSFS